MAYNCSQNPDFKSSTLLNAIKAEASTSYKERIPEATQDNLALVGREILNYSPLRNEFTEALLNRIGRVVITNKNYENPLKMFKKAMMDYGDSVEEVFVDLVKSHSFDPAKAETELYKRNKPDIKSVFHRMNRQDQYVVTVTRQQLKQAFVSEDGMSTLIEKITNSLYVSDEYDEYELMKQLINQNITEGRINKVQVTTPTDEASAKALVTKLKQVSNDMIFMKPDYSYANVKTNSRKEEQVLLIRADLDALIDVEVLAAAFNMDKAQFLGRKHLVDNFGPNANEVIAVLMDEQFLQVWDNLLETDTVENKRGKYINYQLDHWETFSSSPFSNVVAFCTADATITAITLKPDTATVNAGCSFQFNVEVAGTNNPTSKCNYTVTGGNGALTAINSLGFLIVDPGETATELTVTATSVLDANVKDTATVTVVPKA